MTAKSIQSNGIAKALCIVSFHDTFLYYYLFLYVIGYSFYF